MIFASTQFCVAERKLIVGITLDLFFVQQLKKKIGQGLTSWWARLLKLCWEYILFNYLLGFVDKGK